MYTYVEVEIGVQQYVHFGIDRVPVLCSEREKQRALGLALN